jgi:hypothetical protein
MLEVILHRKEDLVLVGQLTAAHLMFSILHMAMQVELVEIILLNAAVMDYKYL